MGSDCIRNSDAQNPFDQQLSLEGPGGGINTYGVIDGGYHDGSGVHDI